MHQANSDYVYWVKSNGWCSEDSTDESTLFLILLICRNRSNQLEANAFVVLGLFWLVTNAI